MAVPHTSASFADLVDKRVTKIFYEAYDELPDVLPQLFGMEKSNDQYERWSGVGALGDLSQFTGSVSYQSQSQGYDTTATHLEFAGGIQIERALYDDDRHGIWEQKPRQLARAASRTRQKHGARIFNNAFSVDTMFYNNSEGVALCSNSHTTTSGASTASGFDNLVTSSLSAVALIAARIQMVQFRDDQANRISVMPDELWIPVDLYDVAYEIVESSGKPDVASNNANVSKGKYKIMPSMGGWNYMTDTNNWFLSDSSMRKDYAKWFDRVPLEFAFAEEIDTIIAKWRVYNRYSMSHFDWRWCVGSQVS